MTDGKRFLVVDDDATIVEIVSRILEYGFDVVSVDMAANAEEALCLLNASQYDFLITDQLMPGMNGTVLIREAIYLYPSLQFILMSSYMDTRLRKEASELGVISLVLKPFEIDEFLRALPADLASTS
ncbi:MAG: response regulator transcription factor [Anaerolineales bacterium]